MCQEKINNFVTEYTNNRIDSNYSKIIYRHSTLLFVCRYSIENVQTEWF